MLYLSRNWTEHAFELCQDQNSIVGCPVEGNMPNYALRQGTQRENVKKHLECFHCFLKKWHYMGLKISQMTVTVSFFLFLDTNLLFWFVANVVHCTVYDWQQTRNKRFMSKNRQKDTVIVTSELFSPIWSPLSRKQ